MSVGQVFIQHTNVHAYIRTCVYMCMCERGFIIMSVCQRGRLMDCGVMHIIL